MDTDAFIGRLRDAGVVGEGGAGFPAHVKYAASVDTVIANGCECEPMLYSDQHIMETHAPEIVQALQEVVKATGASRGVIAIKRKYTRAAQAFQSCLGGASVELAQLDISLDQVGIVERKIMPLMIRMLDGLEQFINLDQPFLLEERQVFVQRIGSRCGRQVDMGCRGVANRAGALGWVKFLNNNSLLEWWNEGGRLYGWWGKEIKTCPCRV